MVPGIGLWAASPQTAVFLISHTSTTPYSVVLREPPLANSAPWPVSPRLYYKASNANVEMCLFWFTVVRVTVLSSDHTDLFPSKSGWDLWLQQNCWTGVLVGVLSQISAAVLVKSFLLPDISEPHLGKNRFKERACTTVLWLNWCFCWGKSTLQSLIKTICGRDKEVFEDMALNGRLFQWDHLKVQTDATERRTWTWDISYTWTAFTWICTECAILYCANFNQIQIRLRCRSSDLVVIRRFTQNLGFYGNRAVKIQTTARCCCYHQPIKQSGFLHNYCLKLLSCFFSIQGVALTHSKAFKEKITKNYEGMKLSDQRHSVKCLETILIATDAI